MFAARLARVTTVARRFASEQPAQALRFAVAPKIDTPPAAKDLILEQPITVVDGRVVASGGGSTGHPINFLNLDQNKVVMCPYSGDFFIRKGAIKPLLSRGAIIEKDGQYFKNPDVTDEE
ncbi:hypothetical protein PTSG_05372 [Salpingoeca rosetta]|uniref:Zinc finger CHCC-type domain-containing protein n=1 Tax=Salpingoeca rosetta (strain ATCC 50818 / BSB-021) TaxID=946362 RepID=F2UA85_SALR5|nr:uncharacterized protein PTSG_05372 [Salpingoeca rosetta]EGD73660.1 hypothetical protein PTSG_05372 [Salpingoeca rosetta]|eukprot:XP_004993941.1 hypothetical protein PTSG_05372 [Salpingoeca rosetta]